jgi:uncharacterized phage protein (TIGR01671 family)
MKFGFRVIGKKTGEQCFEDYFIDSIGALYRQCEMDGSIRPPTDRKDLVVQYATGLLDVSGKEIFEGDIVSFSYGMHEHRVDSTIGEVFFEEGIFYFGRGSMFATNDANLFVESLKIVGNILKNPEALLGV